MHRRSFLIGIGSLMAAPIIVKASSLMPVKVMQPLIPFDIERIVISARSKYLKAEYTIERLSSYEDTLVSEITKLWEQDQSNSDIFIKRVNDEIIKPRRSLIVNTVRSVFVPDAPGGSDRACPESSQVSVRNGRAWLGWKPGGHSLSCVCYEGKPGKFRVL